MSVAVAGDVVARPARHDEAVVVRQLDDLVFPADSDDLQRAPAGELEDAVELGTVYLLECEDRPVGYLHVDRTVEGLVYVGGFGILPDFQGRGLGGWMARAMAPLLEETRGKEPVFTVTSPHNFRMVYFLLTRGFAGRWALPDYFGTGRHRIGLQFVGEESDLFRVPVLEVATDDFDGLRQVMDAGGVIVSVSADGTRFGVAAERGEVDFLPCPRPRSAATP